MSLKKKKKKGLSTRQFYLLLLALFIMLGGTVAVYRSQSDEIRRLETEQEQLKRVQAEQLEEEKRLDNLCNMAGSKEYIERVARDQLGLVRSEEIIFTP